MLLVITPTHFLSAVQPLKTHKEESGLLTTIMTLDEVYRECSGRDEAEKVKRCIASRHAQQGIRYVLLVGDSDTFPVRYTKTDRGDEKACNTAFYPTDLYYACLYKQDGSFDDWDQNGNGYYGELHGETHTGVINIDSVHLHPTVAVGRVPASSVEEVDRFVRKIIRYESQAYGAPWSKNALLMASHDWLRNACRVHERIVRGALKGYSGTILSSTGSPCSGAGNLTAAAVTETLNRGVGLVGYIGHGAPGYLAIPAGLWGINQIPQLVNNNQLPVMCVAGCNTAEFSTLPPYRPYTDVNGTQHIGTEQGESFTAPPPQPACLQRWNDPDGDLATRLTVRIDAGVVAYLGGVTGMQMSEPLEYFFEGIANYTTLGEAWQWMVRRFYQVHGLPGTLNRPDWSVVARVHQPWKFMLFGDPSLRIPRPWSSQQLTSHDRGTSTAPALASYKNKLYMAWKGKDDDPRIFFSVFDGSRWSPQQFTSGDRGTSTAPALAAYKNKLYMVWKGKDDDPRLFFSVFDGNRWSPQQLTSHDRGTSAAPALATYGNKLFMVWKGKDNDPRLFFSVFEGNRWSPQQLTSHDRGTSTAPALATWNNNLYMAWKGKDSDHRLFFSVYNGNAWSQQQLISGVQGTSSAPALACHNDKLSLVWKGKDTDPQIYYSAFDGDRWSPQQLTSYDRGTSATPAFATYKDKLIMAWKGKDNDPRIFFSGL